MNNVAPSRKRTVDAKGGIVFGDEYEVDGVAIPELVARGVLPFRYLQMRGDFGSRFGDCECPVDVIRVLSGEGYWDVHKVSTKAKKSVDIVDKNADSVPESVDKAEMSTEDCGHQIDANWRDISDPGERSRARSRWYKREQRAKKAADPGTA